jgi:hypothetical protein
MALVGPLLGDLAHINMACSNSSTTSTPATPTPVIEKRYKKLGIAVKQAVVNLWFDYLVV